ncbi:MAG: lactonase family protein [Leptospirales bacterium]|nr:lactonase family protein [Leptospirales bacterium]
MNINALLKRSSGAVFLAAAGLLLTRCSAGTAACAEGDANCGLLAVLSYAGSFVPKFVYVLNQNAAGTISMYSVNRVSGAIDPLNPPSIACCNSGSYMTFDPAGRFAFADDLGASVFTYAVDRSSGLLTQTATTSSGGNANPFVVEPGGRFAYGSNNGTTTINVYAYNTITGAVSLRSTATNTGAAATQGSFIDRRGRYLYTANQGSNNVSQFAIDSVSGALAPLGPAVPATGAGYICIDPLDRWLYATNPAGTTIAAYAIQSNGALVSIGVFTTPVAGPSYCAITPDSLFLIAGGAGLSVMPIDPATGALGTGASYSSGVHSGLAISASGEFVFSAEQTTMSLRTFLRNRSSGALTQIDSKLTGTGPSGVLLGSHYSL